MNNFEIPVVVMSVRSGDRKDNKGKYYSLDLGNHRVAFIDESLYTLYKDVECPFKAYLQCHLENAGYKVDYVELIKE